MKKLLLVCMLGFLSSCTNWKDFEAVNNNNQTGGDNPILSSAKEILSFSIGDRVGVITDTDITVTMPFGSSVTDLSPTIVISDKASIDPASGDAQNFRSPLVYTVTAEDGSTKEYTVTVAVAASDSKNITEFILAGIVASIDEDALPTPTISVTVPYRTDVSALAPSISITGVSIDPASGVPQDFRGPVTYIVTAADDTIKTYTVTVTVAPSDSKDISMFDILGVSASIFGTDISLTLPYGTDISSLTPTISITGASVNPASGVAQNFTGAVLYTVTAADTSTKVYTVTVTVADPPPTVSMLLVPVLPGGLTIPTGVDDNGITTVTSAYWIGDTEVTYELWYVVYTWALAHGYTFANAGREGNDGTIGAAPTSAKNEPVTSISWRDIMIWMNACTEWYNETNATSYEPVYYSDAGYTTLIKVVTSDGYCATPGCEDNPYEKPGATGFRFLTSEEWELAARYRGTDTTNTVQLVISGVDFSAPADGLYWTIGSSVSGATKVYNDPSTDSHDYAVYGAGATADVKTKLPNALSIYDMSGNVYEWTSSLSEGGPTKIYRGGCWNCSSDFIRLGSKAGGWSNSPDAGSFGFRVARTPE